MSALRFRVITADPPWAFGDKLSKMKAATPRSAAANYSVLNRDAIKALPVAGLAEDDAVLGLWVPSSMLQDGLDVMKAWGFRQVQEWIWVKLTADDAQLDDGLVVRSDGVLALEKKALLRAMAGLSRKGDRIQGGGDLDTLLVASLPLAFGMGRLARAAKETFLVGVRGSPYKPLKNRSTRDVFFAPAGKHSEKPECFQDALDEMFPEGGRLEMFARRQRPGEGVMVANADGTCSTYPWVCVGNECPATMGEDIRDSLKRLLGVGSAA